jgi:hypothetical protein|tara:strand:- start:9136 stop:9426 length:291 start_codon:yes stop_codon:yes gene_type:complete
MKVGNEYLAIRPAHSFLDISGQKVEFEEEQIKIKVLDKPEHIIACDGYAELVQPLPEHLKHPDWYNVINLNTGLTRWFNSKNYKISEINDLKLTTP